MPPTRPRRGRSLPAAAALVLAVAGLSGCTGDDEADAPPSTTTTTVPEVTFDVRHADVVGPSAPLSPLPEAERAAVAEVVTRFVVATSARPLASGTFSPGDLDGVATADAAARVAGPDRGTVVDDGLPQATRVTVAEASVGLTGLMGTSGAVDLVVADVVWAARASGTRGVTRIRRTGELTLTPVGGAWHVSGYELTVTRDVGSLLERDAEGGVSSTTSTASTGEGS